jgi:fumarate reductase flavoprotein subunit
MTLLSAETMNAGFSTPLAIVGGGACGMVAALAAHDAGVPAIVLERDPVPQGSTAMSSGMIPACGTRFQKAANVDDNADIFAADIQAKAKEQTNPAIVDAVCRASGPAVEWLADRHGVPLTLVEGFLYPGHSRLRMHAPPSRQGADLIAALRGAVERAGIEVVINARVSSLFVDDKRHVTGLRVERPDGSNEDIGCAALILACNGYGGAPAMLREYIPEIAGAEYFGHPGNQGDAVRWGLDLDAGLSCMSAYQGHGSIATPHRILITWALIMQGGIQINLRGERFNNEHEGYSEQAVDVLAQPDGIAWVVFDDRLRELGHGFDDFNAAEAAGALRHGADARALAEVIGVPADALAATIAESQKLAAGKGVDRYGRDFTGAPALSPPFHAIKVTGALLHTQGGLTIDTDARVLRADGSPLPNLFAGGGAACGVSGREVRGYLSGNGLLTAVTLGRIAGRAAAELVGNRAE